jgi:hypothetical protein
MMLCSMLVSHMSLPRSRRRRARLSSGLAGGRAGWVLAGSCPSRHVVDRSAFVHSFARPESWAGRIRPQSRPSVWGSSRSSSFRLSVASERARPFRSVRFPVMLPLFRSFHPADLDLACPHGPAAAARMVRCGTEML